ncbi:MAG: hypothetical protein LBP85_04195 [Prevotellaceae bacterium]|jgi:hypothetical protein|nr:hypothetical protein [Prevotellaceae bacterium]
MKTLINLQKNTQRIIAAAALFFVLSFANNSVNAQTGFYTLEVLQKTDYIIDEIYDIVDYFYFNDGEFIAKSVHFQDYAYCLYDSKNYRQAIQYSLMARSYAINAMEICDDYWQYYDYHYYGYSPAWGRNSGFTVKIGNTQLHWGLSNARYHNNLRVNWDLYFTARELRYYKNLPSETVLLNGLYKYRGRVVYFNDRHSNRNVYITMRTRMNKGKDNYAKYYPNATKHMSAKPKNIKPNNAPTPVHKRRETPNRVNNSHNNHYNNNGNEKNKPIEKNKNTGDNRRNDSYKSNRNKEVKNNGSGSQSSQTGRSNTGRSQTTTSTKKTDDNHNSAQKNQTRRQSTQSSDTKQQSSSNASSSNSSSRRR